MAPAEAAEAAKKKAEEENLAAEAAKRAEADLVGNIARIKDLKAQPDLNGSLCRVLRKAEAKAKAEDKDAAKEERFVVRSGLKEYALKPANLETGDALLPGSAKVIAGLILTTSLLGVVEIATQGGRYSVGVAVVPFTAAFALLGSLALCYRLYWPGREEGEWLPSVSELSIPEPSLGVFRTGLLAAGLLLAVTTWLHGALVMGALVDYTPPPLPQANATDADNMTNVTNETRAAHQRYTDTLANGPEDSIWWGNAAAFGLVTQGLFTFEGRICPRSAVHVLGSAVFLYAGFQQGVLTTMVISSPRGHALVSASPGLATVIRARQYAVDYLPLALLAIPLMSQYTAFSNRNTTPAMPTLGSALKASGTTKLVGFLQWAGALSYAVLLASFSCELIVASWL